MTSLVDEFLNDLGTEDVFLDDDGGGGDNTSETQDSVAASADDNMAIDENDSGSGDDSGDEKSGIFGELNFRGIHWENIAKLVRSKQLQMHLESIDKYVAAEGRESSHQMMGGAALVDDPEYPLIVESNRLATEIDDEIALMHRYLIDIYRHRFPDLENNVQNALDYARVVKRIGNETDLANADMSDILPQSIIMVIKITSATDIGRKLSDKELQRALRACDDMLLLDEYKRKILRYVSSRMSIVAPNLSAIVGPTVAAQLIGAAGGLTALSKIPAANIQALGKSRKNLVGFSAKGTKHASVRHVGFIAQCDLINSTPPALRTKAGRLIATKGTLAARVDSFHSSPDGSFGRKIRAEIEDTIKRWQEPPPAKQEKPLPAPDAKKRRKRGGRNARRIKSKYKMTEVRRKYNRLAFGPEGEEEDGITGRGFGMLGAEGSGQMRVRAETKVKYRKQQDAGSRTSTPYYGAQTAVSGLASSLAFTPMQGIQLENPLNALRRMQQTGSGDMSSISGTATALAGIGSSIPRASTPGMASGASSSVVGQKRPSYFGNSSFAAAANSNTDASKKQKKTSDSKN